MGSRCQSRLIHFPTSREARSPRNQSHQMRAARERPWGAVGAPGEAGPGGPRGGCGPSTAPAPAAHTQPLLSRLVLLFYSLPTRQRWRQATLSLLVPSRYRSRRRRWRVSHSEPGCDTRASSARCPARPRPEDGAPAAQGAGTVAQAAGLCEAAQGTTQGTAEGDKKETGRCFPLGRLPPWRCSLEVRAECSPGGAVGRRSVIG